MEIKTTLQIRSKLIPSVSETEANIYWKKKWVAVDDLINKIVDDGKGNMCIDKAVFFELVRNAHCSCDKNTIMNFGKCDYCKEKEEK